MKSRLKYIAIGLSLLTLAGCSGSLPGCSSSEAKELIENMTNERAYKFGSFVKLNSAKEQAYNKDAQIRTCTADLVTTKGMFDAYYNISWDDQEAGSYQIEVRYD